MSISKFQDRLLGKGCGAVVSVIFALIMMTFVFQTCYRGGMGPGGSGTSSLSIVATVGGIDVTDQQLLERTRLMTDQMQQQMAQQPSAPPLTFGDKANIASRALGLYMGNAAALYIAQRDHIPITDDALTKVAVESLQQQIERAKMQLAMSGKIKPTATPQEIDKAFAQAYGKPADQLVAEKTADFKQKLADKDQKAMIQADLVTPILIDVFASKSVPSEQEVKANFLTYIIKRIYFKNKPGGITPNADAVDAKATKALTDLKKGMSFEDAMDKYSEDPVPGKGRKVRDNVVNEPATLIDQNPDYKLIKGQKAGYVSALVPVVGGKAILKLDLVRDDTPKDFDKNKAKYILDQARPKAQKAFTDELQKVLTSNVVKWENQGYKALFDYYQALMDPAQTNRTAVMQKVVDEANAALKASSGPEIEPASYALYDAFEAIWTAPGADKTKLRDQRIDVLNAALKLTEDYGFRMELANLYMEKKDGFNAMSNLVSASKQNSQYDAVGQGRWGDIAAKRADLVKQGLLKEADLKDLDAAQTGWRAAKVDYDKQAALSKQQEAEQKRIDAENAKKNAAMEKKNAEMVKKQQQEEQKRNGGKPTTPPPTTTGGSLLPPTQSTNTGGTTGSLLPPGMGH